MLLWKFSCPNLSLFQGLHPLLFLASGMRPPSHSPGNARPSGHEGRGHRVIPGPFPRTHSGSADTCVCGKGSLVAASSPVCLLCPEISSSHTCSRRAVLPAAVGSVCLHTLFFHWSSRPSCLWPRSLPAFAHPSSNVCTRCFVIHVIYDVVHNKTENGCLCTSFSIPSPSDRRSVITCREYSSDMSIICVPPLVVKYNILLYLNLYHLSNYPSIIYLSIYHLSIHLSSIYLSIIYLSIHHWSIIYLSSIYPSSIYYLSSIYLCLLPLTRTSSTEIVLE